MTEISIDWKQRAERAEAACAEKDAAIWSCVSYMNHDYFCTRCGVLRPNHADDCQLGRALSTDCGKGWVSPDKLSDIRDAWMKSFEETHAELGKRLTLAVEALNDACAKCSRCNGSGQDDDGEAYLNEPCPRCLKWYQALATIEGKDAK